MSPRARSQGPSIWHAPLRSLKKRSENAGANENLSCEFPSIPGIAPEVAPRVVVFALLHSENWISHFEITVELRELLLEHPATLPELREWPFHSEIVFPEIGVVPKLLTPCSGSVGPKPFSPDLLRHWKALELLLVAGRIADRDHQIELPRRSHIALLLSLCCKLFLTPGCRRGKLSSEAAVLWTPKL